ncbi:MAG: DUF58 domain-containing protein [Coriobacteriia bacterium]|nr:DUF58 domain-containing protein [Coriobacteriia bacterium]
MAKLKKNRTKKNSGGILAALKRSRKVLACVALGIALAVPIPFVNTVIGYAPLIGYLILLALSFAYLKILAPKLTFDSEGIGDGCIRGERIPFKLVVRNESPLPAVCVQAKFFISDLFGDEGASTQRLVTLPPRSTKTFDFGVRFDHLGTYTVGIQQIRITDPFGVFAQVKENPEMHQVLVQPQVHNVAGLQISTDDNVESKKSFATVINDGMDYRGVREYRWGDPLKAIHWKLSAGAATKDYFTRLYETATNPGVEIIADLDNPRTGNPEELMCAYDAIMEAVLSIDEWCAAQGLESTLLFVDDAGRTRRFSGPLERMQAELMERMPRIAEGSGVAAIDLLGQEANSIYAQNNLVFITSCITQDLVGAITSARMSRRNPILIAIIPSCLDADTRQEMAEPLKRLGMAGIPYTIISQASDLGGQNA